MAEACVLQEWTPNLTRQEVWGLLLKEEEDETVYKLPTFILLSILMAVGLPGNVLVLLVYGFRFPPSTTKSFIMAMAAFDLINCALGLPFEMVDLRYDTELSITVVCKIFRFWVSLSACGSVTVLVTVSVDRFRRICRPFQKQMTVRQSKEVIGVMSLLSVGFAVPALILYGRQTDIRYGIELHDCSIDDAYRSQTFAAVYQYILGTTWTVSIIVLVIMYSFIIYKINLQKKRRSKLSSQSHGSTSVLARQQLQTSVDCGPQHKDIARTSADPTSFVKHTHTNPHNHTASPHINTPRPVEKNLNLHSDCNENNPAKSRGSNIMSRLFSRDANPILEDAENDDGNNDNYDDDVSVYDTDEEHMPLPDFEFNAKLIRYKKTSLNNYLADSQDTTFTHISEGTLQTEATVSSTSALNQMLEVSRDRRRKQAHSHGRYRPWDSQKSLSGAEIVSSLQDRNWMSYSDQLVAGGPGHRRDDSCRVGRSFSLCSLKCVGSQQRPGNPTSGCHRNGLGTVETDVNDDKKRPSGANDKKRPLDADTKKRPLGVDECASPQAVSSAFSLTSSATTTTTTAPPSSGQSRATFVSGESGIQKSTTANHTDMPLCTADPPGQKSKATSTETALTLTMAHVSRKKTLSREIKTSKVSIMMLMVTLGFVLSYLPHLAIQIYKSIFPSTAAGLLCSSQVYFVLYHLLMRSFFINNAINPIIYSFYNKTFRQRCLRLLKAPRSLFYSTDQAMGHVLSFSQDNDTS